MKKTIYFLLFFFTILTNFWASPTCLLKGIIIDGLTEKKPEALRIYNRTLRATAVQDSSFLLPIRLGTDNILLFQGEEYWSKEQTVHFEECPEIEQIFVIQPKVKELEEIEIGGYNAKTMLYQMIHQTIPNLDAVSIYADTKRYDPTQLPDNIISQISSPISSIFALSNKKSRQRRKIDQYKKELPETTPQEIPKTQEENQNEKLETTEEPSPVSN